MDEVAAVAATVFCLAVFAFANGERATQTSISAAPTRLRGLSPLSRVLIALALAEKADEELARAIQNNKSSADTDRLSAVVARKSA
jgi:hypothetical protein